jgi:hypothetical protein
VAGYEAYKDNVFETAHLSDADYRRLVARPAVAREKVRAALTADVGQTAEQVHAAHILVDTKDLADTIYAELQQPGANFEQTARDQSNDTSTAPNGGDLGWFARGQMVDPFEQSAFSQAIGSVSQPVQSEFGWHIIKVYEREPNRALSDQQLEQYRENIINDWLTATAGRDGHLVLTSTRLRLQLSATSFRRRTLPRCRPRRHRRRRRRPMSPVRWRLRPPPWQSMDRPCRRRHLRHHHRHLQSPLALLAPSEGPPRRPARELCGRASYGRSVTT